MTRYSVISIFKLIIILEYKKTDEDKERNSTSTMAEFSLASHYIQMPRF